MSATNGTNVRLSLQCFVAAKSATGEQMSVGFPFLVTTLSDELIVWEFLRLSWKPEREKSRETEHKAISCAMLCRSCCAAACKYQLTQMNPRDALPRGCCSQRLYDQCNLTVDRRRYCQLLVVFVRKKRRAFRVCSFHHHRQSRLHSCSTFQYATSCLSKFTIVRRLLLKGNLKTYYFPRALS